jgi:hypothetical protein
MRFVLSVILLSSVAMPALASDPPPAPESDIPATNGIPPLPSDTSLPPPPSPDLPAPLSLPPPGAKINAPPAPPAPIWVINTYQWLNGGWVKQPDHCLKTPDVRQAADYCLELSRFPGWYYQTNVPLSCCNPAVKANAEVPASAPIPNDYPSLTLSVWAFKFVGGKWVKDEKYCWTARDFPTMRLDMTYYAKRLNAIPGWCATTNAPESVRGQPTADAMAPPVPSEK